MYRDVPVLWYPFKSSLQRKPFFLEGFYPRVDAESVPQTGKWYKTLPQQLHITIERNLLSKLFFIFLGYGHSFVGEEKLKAKILYNYFLVIKVFLLKFRQLVINFLVCIEKRVKTRSYNICQVSGSIFAIFYEKKTWTCHNLSVALQL